MNDAQAQGGDEARGRRLRALLPLAIFVAVLALLGVGLTGNPRELPSALIDKPAPAFRLTTLATPLAPERTLGSAELRGQRHEHRTREERGRGQAEEHRGTGGGLHREVFTLVLTPTPALGADG